MRLVHRTPNTLAILNPSLRVSGSWGYTYTVFFDGNAFHMAGGTPSLIADATNTNGCSFFSTTIDGVLTFLVPVTEYDVVITDVADGGFTLSPSPTAFVLSPSATADEVTDALSVLPSVNTPMLTYRGVADERLGNSWTLSFSSNGGAVAELVCVKGDNSFVGNCDVSTRQNVVQLHMYLSATLQVSHSPA